MFGVIIFGFFLLHMAEGVATNCYECWGGTDAGKTELIKFVFADTTTDESLNRAIAAKSDDCDKTLAASFQHQCTDICQLVYISDETAAISTCKTGNSDTTVINKKYNLETCSTALCNNKITPPEKQKEKCNSATLAGINLITLLLSSLAFFQSK